MCLWVFSRSSVRATRVDVELLAMLYIEADAGVAESTRLVVDALNLFERRLGPGDAPLPGEGISFSLRSMSLYPGIPICFGFENSFIFDLSNLPLLSFSVGSSEKEVSPGESCMLRGYAALAADVAATVGLGAVKF